MGDVGPLNAPRGVVSRDRASLSRKWKKEQELDCRFVRCSLTAGINALRNQLRRKGLVFVHSSRGIYSWCITAGETDSWQGNHGGRRLTGTWSSHSESGLRCNALGVASRSYFLQGGSYLLQVPQPPHQLMMKHSDTRAHGGIHTQITTISIINRTGNHTREAHRGPP